MAYGEHVRPFRSSPHDLDGFLAGRGIVAEPPSMPRRIAETTGIDFPRAEDIFDI